MRRVMQGPLNPTRSAVQADQEAGTSSAVFVTPAVQQSHPSAAKAIVVFNGTSGAITPLFAFNVTTVTANAAGDYTVQFITPFSTSGYAAIATAESTGGNIPDQLSVASGTMLASSVRMLTRNPGGTLTNFDHTAFVFYGDQ